MQVSPTAITVLQNVGLGTIGLGAVAAAITLPDELPGPIKHWFDKNKTNPWLAVGLQTALAGVAGLALISAPGFKGSPQWVLDSVKQGSYLLMVGGGVGGLVAAGDSFFNSKKVPRGADQGELVPLNKILPPTIDELSNVTVARAEAHRLTEIPLRPDIYVDTTGFAKPADPIHTVYTDREKAFAAASLAARKDPVSADKGARTFAIIQIADGTFRIAPLAQSGGALKSGGSLQRIDGPNYDNNGTTKLNPAMVPGIERGHIALVGLAGTEHTIRLYDQEVVPV